MLLGILQQIPDPRIEGFIRTHVTNSFGNTISIIRCVEQNLVHSILKYLSGICRLLSYESE